MAKKITAGKNPKYRIKKTIRDVTAPMGIDYTPEAVNNDGSWTQLAPACYKEDDAIDVLRLRKKQDEIKVEYIYPQL